MARLNVRPAPATQALAAGHLLFAAGERGPLWRVRVGTVRLDKPQRNGAQLVQLAFAGDLIGVEALCGQAYQFSAQGLTACEIEPVLTAHERERESLMRQALLQQQQRSLDMASLRTGAVPLRLAHLLHMLGLDWRACGSAASTVAVDVQGLRRALPPLRELAHVVDAKVETVCRALARLLPAPRVAPVSG